MKVLNEMSAGSGQTTVLETMYGLYKQNNRPTRLNSSFVFHRRTNIPHLVFGHQATRPEKLCLVK